MTIHPIATWPALFSYISLSSLLLSESWSLRLDLHLVNPAEYNYPISYRRLSRLHAHQPRSDRNGQALWFTEPWSWLLRQWHPWWRCHLIAFCNSMNSFVIMQSSELSMVHVLFSTMGLCKSSYKHITVDLKAVIRPFLLRSFWYAIWSRPELFYFIVVDERC